MTDKFITFDEALAELQMATNELRSLVTQGKIDIEGDGLQLNFRLSQIQELKKSLQHEGEGQLTITRQEMGKGWSREGGLIIWRGRAPARGWVMLKTAPQDWEHMHFRLFFDVRGSLERIGLAAGDRLLAIETGGNPVAWHAFLVEMHKSTGRVLADDREIFSGELPMPFLALCGGGPSELSQTNQDSLIFRGLKLERLRE